MERFSAIAEKPNDILRTADFRLAVPQTALKKPRLSSRVSASDPGVTFWAFPDNQQVCRAVSNPQRDPVPHRTLF